MRRLTATLALSALTILAAPRGAGPAPAPEPDPPDRTAVDDTTLAATLQAAVDAYLESLWQERLAVQAFLDWHYVERHRPILDCIAARESRGDYYAENPTSTASGRYQWLDRSWRAASSAAGRHGWARASSAPPEVQDYVTTWWIDHHGTGAWRASGAHRC
jgi:hypothetical protein